MLFDAFFTPEARLSFMLFVLSTFLDSNLVVSGVFENILRANNSCSLVQAKNSPLMGVLSSYLLQTVISSTGL